MVGEVREREINEVRTKAIKSTPHSDGEVTRPESGQFEVELVGPTVVIIAGPGGSGGGGPVTDWLTALSALELQSARWSGRPTTQQGGPSPTHRTARRASTCSAAPDAEIMQRRRGRRQ